MALCVEENKQEGVSSQAGGKLQRVISNSGDLDGCSRGPTWRSPVSEAVALGPERVTGEVLRLGGGEVLRLGGPPHGQQISPLVSHGV